MVELEYSSLRNLLRTLHSQYADGKVRFSLKRVKNMLCILIKHHLLIVETVNEDSPAFANSTEQTAFLYSIDIDEAIWRMKFPKFLVLAQTRFGTLGEVIAENLIFSGSLRFPQLIEAIQADSRVIDNTEEEIKSTFIKLVHAKFILSVKPLTPKPRAEQAIYGKASSGTTKAISAILSTNVANVKQQHYVKAGATSSSATAASASAATATASGTKKRGRKSAASSNVAASAAAAMNMLPVELRMAMTAANQTSTHDGEEEEWNDGTGVASSSTALPDPKRRRGLPQSLEIDGNQIDVSVRWRLHPESLLVAQKHDLCQTFIEEQHGAIAGCISKVIMQKSTAYEVDYHAAASKPMTFQELSQQLKKVEAFPKNIDETMLRNLLELMRLSASRAITRTDQAHDGSQYLINYDALLAAIKRRSIHQIAVGKFGPDTARILELLLRGGRLEQQIIVDKIIMPARETRERLYALFMANWISYHELSKRGDYSASSSFFFWYIDGDRLASSMLQLLYKALYNVHVRLEIEIKKGNEAQVGQQQCEERMQVLYYSLLQLDDTLLILDQL